MAAAHENWQKHVSKAHLMPRVTLPIMEPRPPGKLAGAIKVIDDSVQPIRNITSPMDPSDPSSSSSYTVSRRRKSTERHPLLGLKSNNALSSNSEHTLDSVKFMGAEKPFETVKSTFASEENMPYNQETLIAQRSLSEDYTSIGRQSSASRPESSGYISGTSTASTPDRSSTAFSQRIKITEYNAKHVNPEPLAAEDTDLLLEDHLSARKLKALTGENNLEKVQVLELKVDTRETSLGDFGAHLPNLTQLKLSNSIITSLRDLGSSLHNLQVLWMTRCGLEDLNLVSMSNLRELYLAYNELSDISDCRMLEHLKILDLEGNNIDDITQVEILALCDRLTHLTLDGNPVCITPSPDQADPSYNYRQAVKNLVPQLRYLDDELLVDCEQTKSVCVFNEDWKLLEELIEEAGDLPVEELVGPEPTRPGTAKPSTAVTRLGTAVRPATTYRPGTALKQQVSRPLTAGKKGTARPTTARSQTPGTPSSRPKSGEAEDDCFNDDVSSLNIGGHICGNPSRFLHNLYNAKNKTATSLEQDRGIPQAYEKYSSNVKKTADIHEEDDELMSEISAWRKEYHKTRAKLEAEMAPQVLKIEHDDVISLSDDEDVCSDLEDDLSSNYMSIHENIGLKNTWESAGADLSASQEWLRNRRTFLDQTGLDSHKPSTQALKPIAVGLPAAQPLVGKTDSIRPDRKMTAKLSYEEKQPSAGSNTRNGALSVTPPSSGQKSAPALARMTNLSKVQLLPNRPPKFK